MYANYQTQLKKINVLCALGIPLRSSTVLYICMCITLMLSYNCGCLANSLYLIMQMYNYMVSIILQIEFMHTYVYAYDVRTLYMHHITNL